MENNPVRSLKDDENVEETHLYINENGALVDQTLFRDKKNEILILSVPAHHDRVENQVVFDENSEWMMTIIPKMKRCEVMKKHPMFTNEKKAFEYAKNDKSTSGKPIEVNSKKVKTFEMSLSTYIGYNFSHEYLPKKFQSLCPSHFTPYTTRVVPEGENPALYDVESEEDLYDFVPGLSTTPHPRLTRRSIENLGCTDDNGNTVSGCTSVSFPCMDHDGKPFAGSDCYKIYGLKCTSGKRCKASKTIYKCESRQESSTSGCWYFTVPCFRLPDHVHDWDFCIAHMRNTNQKCTTCCENQNCGTAMPKC
jgi:hypothetical protein